MIMNKLLRTILIGSFAALCIASVCHEAAAQNLTVATYNIRNKNDGDARAGNGWDSRYPWICSLIEFEGIDIFGSQEVLEPQLEDMLEALPEYGYVGAGRDDGRTKGEYAPIFYRTDRFTVLGSGWFWLSETPDVPSKGWDAALPRICTWGHFKDRETGRKLWFFNLHMDHVGVHARAEGARLVVSRIKEWCGKNETVFLTGDFKIDSVGSTKASRVSPLVIMDGLEVSDDVIKKLNPKKIQSVSVLKNEAATAKYGKKGKFGVILITTKRE